MGSLARVPRTHLLAAILLALLLAVGAACGSDSAGEPAPDEIVLLATSGSLRPLSDLEADLTAEVVEKRASRFVGRSVSARWWDERRVHLIVAGLDTNERQDPDLQRLLTVPGRIELEANPQILMPSYTSAFDAVEASTSISIPGPYGGSDVAPGRVEYLFGAAPERPIIAGPVFLDDPTESRELVNHVAPPGSAPWPPEGATSRAFNRLLQLRHRRLPIGTEGAATTEWFLAPYPRVAVSLRASAMVARPSSPRTVKVAVRVDNNARRQLSGGLPEFVPDALSGSSSKLFLLLGDRIVASADIQPSAPLPSDPRIHGGLQRNLLFENVERADWDDIEALRESGPLPADVSLALLS